MPEFQLTVNQKVQRINAADDLPLLWVLRDLLRLTGTKYGCGLGVCGICTVHIDGKARRSCLISIKEAASGHITTIEGLSKNGDHPVQEAWKEAKVPQCGYCQPGQIMQAAALLIEHPTPKPKLVASTMSTVLCRCGTYPRIKNAIELASKKIRS